MRIARSAAALILAAAVSIPAAAPALAQDFDADPTAADHTALLDEIRQAATSGVRSASAPLVAAASEVQRQVKELRAAERSIQAATASITAARSAAGSSSVSPPMIFR